MQGMISRRILINYRVDPELLARQLPAPFRVKRVAGFGMVGICLIRLERVRPAKLPKWLGITSENAAHRAAVEWDDTLGTHNGVYIERRDTDLWLNQLAGGRVFPGIHHRARFTVNESTDRFDVAFNSVDRESALVVRSHLAEHWPPSSIFRSIGEVSEFFQAGSLGYSATTSSKRLHGLELRCSSWHVEPLEIDELCSSVFENERRFPKGSLEFDCALLMRGIEHEWHGLPDLCCEPAAA
jgi:hypothetical protein